MPPPLPAPIGSRRRREPRRLLAALVAAALGAGGCAVSREAAAPTAASHRVRVERVVALGPYLGAGLVGPGGTVRFYFPPSSVCRRLLREGAGGVFVPTAFFGVLTAAGEAAGCEPVGVEGLSVWRDRLPQRRSRYLLPRETAHFRPAGRADGMLLARGRFPLAVELRFPNPDDVVAVLPATAACRSLLAAGSGMLEFRSEGEEALLFPDSGCPVRGLARPLALE